MRQSRAVRKGRVATTASPDRWSLPRHPRRETRHQRAPPPQSRGCGRNPSHSSTEAIAVAATASVYVDAVREAGLPQRRAVRSHPLRLRRLSPRVRRRRSVGTQEGARPRLPRQHRRRCSKSELLCPAEGSLALDEFRFISVWRPHAIELLFCRLHASQHASSGCMLSMDPWYATTQDTSRDTKVQAQEVGHAVIILTC